MDRKWIILGILGLAAYFFLRKRTSEHHGLRELDFEETQEARPPVLNAFFPPPAAPDPPRVVVIQNETFTPSAATITPELTLLIRNIVKEELRLSRQVVMPGVVVSGAVASGPSKRKIELEE